MKVAGIIAEYNPFHSGHARQIAALRKMGYTCVVAVMSPCAVQRGSPAIMPSSVRVKAAIEGGIDLVLCLPAPYALCSAEGFAAAGVRVLDSLGNVDTLCFGMRAKSTEDITDAAKLMTGSEYQSSLRVALDGGLSYPASCAAAIKSLDIAAAELLCDANNLLGIAYCKALSSQNSSMQPLGIQRTGAQHDEALSEGKGLNIASASALRTMIYAKQEYKQYVPKECNTIYSQALAKGLVLNKASFDMAVLSRLRAMDKGAFAAIRGVNEGLENRLYSAVQNAACLEELYSSLKCKRYAHSRIRRLVFNAALGYTPAVNVPVPYLHVLGASSCGLAVMSSAKALGALPISSSLAELEGVNAACRLIGKAHSACEDLAALCLNVPQSMGSAYTTKMYKK